MNLYWTPVASQDNSSGWGEQHLIRGGAECLFLHAILAEGSKGRGFPFEKCLINLGSLQYDAIYSYYLSFIFKSTF